MKKALSVFVMVLILVSLFTCALADPEKSWYELSGENTILTVRLPGNNKDGMDWDFEISNPAALELLTMEELVGETEGMAGAPTTFVASFASMASAENKVTLILRYATDDANEPAFATRILEMNVSSSNVLSIVSVCERNQSAEWLEYDDDNFVLTLRLPASENGSDAWEMSLLNPEFMEMITCDTETGYVGSFVSNLEGAGFTELYLKNGSTLYTVNLFASEAGDLFVEWAEVFEVLP